ncbi:MAG: sulfatase-like hydrolase/transferase [Bacteroidales bacterium]|jgi:phosphoglycerol transferase MdoB-like AlkP superfamily enzyme|nr:sulfatase-like hydrolase/transferase [Bacteroidales bacterium]MDI9591485.1 sulfatase-like hydrolase/transferase [Bacteroidota bacterium]HOF80326.1 sulfatase-like hydrolase/transferase [Bacteroidales bacterium]HOR75576.1 sulfatase-like hydrolase/transferase [Bacteroidales bacterium]HPL10998.1 sulfatase-like hydrolase/transferase [Bacteroidales bacterium]
MTKAKYTKGYYRVNSYTVLTYRLLIALLFLWISRILFYIFNFKSFNTVTTIELFHVFISGLRFDLSSLFMLNLPFIILMTFPLPFRHRKFYWVTSDFLFYVPNLMGIAVNIADIVYFRFTQKRMTGDIFDFVSAGIPIQDLIPQFMRDFWPFLFLFIFIAIIFYLIIRKVYYYKRRFTEGVISYYLFQMISFVITLFLSVLMIRGGIQMKPVNIITGIQYVRPSNLPLILNTPFTIIKTIDHQVMMKVDYFEPQALEKIYSPEHHFNTDRNNTLMPDSVKKNVVVIIMESLSSEHIGAFNRQVEGYQGYTPFLDSLIDHSIAFNGFANAKQSIEGLPAIIASIPALMDRPFITSAFAGNSFDALAALLEKKGYETSFFHGGTNGTMDFDRFARASGFKRYYGRNEYDNDMDFDGRWGIFDEPFFQFFAKKLDKTSQPFLSVFFSLSAHHPYTIPNQYKGQFRKGNLQIQEAIMYSDYSLKRFFDTAKTMEWYQNTLFVITADHTSEAFLTEYKTRVGMYRIPVIFYSPAGNLRYDNEKVVSQVDIMPSVLALIDYKKPFVAFGNNIFNSNKPDFAVSYINGVFQMVRNHYLIEFDGEETVALFDFDKDKQLKHNIMNVETVDVNEMEELLKAYIQQYYNRLIENRMTVK